MIVSPHVMPGFSMFPLHHTVAHGH